MAAGAWRVLSGEGEAAARGEWRGGGGGWGGSVSGAGGADAVVHACVCVRVCVGCKVTGGLSEIVFFNVAVVHGVTAGHCSSTWQSHG